MQYTTNARHGKQKKPTQTCDVRRVCPIKTGIAKTSPVSSPNYCSRTNETAYSQKLYICVVPDVCVVESKSMVRLAERTALRRCRLHKNRNLSLCRTYIEAKKHVSEYPRWKRSDGYRYALMIMEMCLEDHRSNLVSAAAAATRVGRHLRLRPWSRCWRRRHARVTLLRWWRWRKRLCSCVRWLDGA